MFTNELKKGDRVLLRNGWYATIEDNARGNTRLASVEGFGMEMGSVFSHDIICKANGDGTMTMIEHTPQQKKLRGQVEELFE